MDEEGGDIIQNSIRFNKKNQKKNDYSLDDEEEMQISYDKPISKDLESLFEEF